MLAWAGNRSVAHNNIFKKKIIPFLGMLKNPVSPGGQRP